MPGGWAAGGCGQSASRLAVRLVAWLTGVLSAPSRAPMTFGGRCRCWRRGTASTWAVRPSFRVLPPAAAGGRVCGGAGLAFPPSGARRPLAGVSLPEVAVLLVAGAERDLQRGGQGGQVRRVHAGQRGMVQQAAGGAAGTGWLWFRLRFRGGPGDGQDGVVPLAVELVAC